MARSQRSSKLETRTARLKLPPGRREFLTIGKGLALAYRRTEDGYGTWQARVWDAGRYNYRNLGRADDHQDANEIDVLDFYQAQGKAREAFEVITKGRPSLDPITVEDAGKRYLAWYAEQRKALRETEHALRVHILPRFGDKLITELTAPQIRAWLEKLAATPARVRTSAFAKKQSYRKAPQTAEQKRARRATANRILSILRALLNKAFHDGLVKDDTAWRQVKPFARVDEPRIRFLTDADAIRLVEACRPDLRSLVQAALLTGARVSELTTLQVNDVNLPNSQIYIPHSKSGRPRFVPLNLEGAALFRDIIVDKRGDSLVFIKKDGKPWGKNHHVRSLLEACKAAKIRPAISFHELRHTYASQLAQAGVDLLTISKLLGHADTRVTSRHYAHLADKTLAQAVTKLPSFGAPVAKDAAAIR